ncbi:MAG: phosphoenolpyruvate--protein phosphotransferase, partial [Planctomycetales bacterium]|nr:phosphoenolpyruvate--protein phosphotransferase [Planctomycetales bacterium]
DTHLLMLEDKALSSQPIQLIRNEGFSAEWALQQHRDALVRVFEQMDDSYLRTRCDDIDHVVSRIVNILLEQHEPQFGSLQGQIVLAEDLTPADVILMKNQGVAGFVTDYGGPMSHTAILARNLGLPGVVGARCATTCLQHGEHLLLDAENGVVLADCDDTMLAYFESLRDAAATRTNQLRRRRAEPATTRDGQRIAIQANIELADDVVAARANGADGIGLYRTEFLYMNRAAPPDEEEHFAAYLSVVNGMHGQPVTIRTLDLGADKIDEQRDHSYERNPFLGLRSIRLSLRHTDVFRTQLRAILRASHFGDLRVMFPLISTLTEWRQARKLLWDCMDDLDREGVPINREIPVGIMVEVPAAVVMLDRFLKEVDFISIGTNDLVQYTLAVDRSNKDVASLYSAADPSVIRMIHTAVGLAERFGKPVSLCGQMSASPLFVGLLLGLGLRSLSVPPSAIPEIKRIVRALKLSHCRQMAERALELDSADEVEQYLRDELALVVPASLEALGGEAKSAGNR